MSHYQQDVEALLAAILVRASDVLELPEHDREARIKFFRNAAYEDRMMVTSNKDHANDFEDRMEAWIRVMVQIMEEGVAVLPVTPNDGGSRPRCYPTPWGTAALRRRADAGRLLRCHLHVEELAADITVILGKRERMISGVQIGGGQGSKRYGCLFGTGSDQIVLWRSKNQHRVAPFGSETHRVGMS